VPELLDHIILGTSLIESDPRMIIIQDDQAMLSTLLLKTILFANHERLVNQCLVLVQNLTNKSMSGTSMSTPTTVAKAAPEERP